MGQNQPNQKCNWLVLKVTSSLYVTENYTKVNSPSTSFNTTLMYFKGKLFCYTKTFYFVLLFKKKFWILKDLNSKEKINKKWFYIQNTTISSHLKCNKVVFSVNGTSQYCENENFQYKMKRRKSNFHFASILWRFALDLFFDSTLNFIR